MVVGDIPLYNSFNNVVYNQVIQWINPEAPVIDGLTNSTITVGAVFDPLAGVTAYDPTRDGDNPEGTTPKNLTGSIVIVSGSVDINTPGTYTLVYKVTSPYGIETTGERIITVVASDNGGGGDSNGSGTTGGGTLPSTGNGLLFMLGTLVIFTGIGTLRLLKIY